MKTLFFIFVFIISAFAKNYNCAQLYAQTLSLIHDQTTKTCMLQGYKEPTYGYWFTIRDYHTSEEYQMFLRFNRKNATMFTFKDSITKTAKCYDNYERRIVYEYEKGSDIAQYIIEFLKCEDSFKFYKQMEP